MTERRNIGHLDIPAGTDTYDGVVRVVKAHYWSIRPESFHTIVLDDADFNTLSERKALLDLCATLLDFGVKTIRHRTNHTRAVASALAFINRTRVTVQQPLDPSTAGWTADDVFVEARRLGWKEGRS